MTTFNNAKLEAKQEREERLVTEWDKEQKENKWLFKFFFGIAW